MCVDIARPLEVLVGEKNANGFSAAHLAFGAMMSMRHGVRVEIISNLLVVAS